MGSRAAREFKRTSGALALALLAACAAAPPAKGPPPVNLSGYPAEFRQGHADGCASAAPGARTRRDEARFANDRLYAQGWKDGYDICRQRK